MSTLTEQIIELLNHHHLKYILKEHAPTPTSDDSARERGESKKIGAKALLFKTDQIFTLCILPADRLIDSKKLKEILNIKKIRMATLEELKEHTSCDKGAVPPFGHLVNTNMIVDSALFEEEYMAFNAGSLTISIKMKTQDYKNIIKPTTASFTTTLESNK